ncbi:MAG TPA: hypothetical protein ENK18_07875 [Deltaproteobacteria bacterium]|nr:hypothetical protein [Deltaproteobacteria bacterium]
MSLSQALDKAIEAAEGLVDPAPLVAAAATLDRGWRVAVVGRVASGKSTLVNWLAGAPVQPTGLGGTTRRLHTVEAQGSILIDTPGMDAPAEALLTLQPVLDSVDAVLWVVDGLQPVTASEREILESTLVEGTPLTVIVSKIDLLEEPDRIAVLRRAELLASRWSLQQVAGHDLRTNARRGLDPGHLGAPAWPGPRRIRTIRRALSQLQEALDQLHPPPDLRGLLSTWTSAIRAAVAEVTAEIESGTVQHKDEALVALASHVPEVNAALQRLLEPHRPPRLPAPDPPHVTMMRRIFDGMSGAEGALRILRADAARWLAEGQLILREWWEEQEALQQRGMAHETLRERLRALETLLEAADPA